MKRLLTVIVLSITLLFSCTKPLDNIVILKVKDKNADTNVGTVDSAVVTTTDIIGSGTALVTTAPDQPSGTTTVDIVDGERLLILNKSSKMIHLSDSCSYAAKISETNRLSVPYAELYSYLQNGYEICSYCEKHY